MQNSHLLDYFELNLLKRGSYTSLNKKTLLILVKLKFNYKLNFELLLNYIFCRILPVLLKLEVKKKHKKEVRKAKYLAKKERKKFVVKWLINLKLFKNLDYIDLFLSECFAILHSTGEGSLILEQKKMLYIECMKTFFFKK